MDFDKRLEKTKLIDKFFVLDEENGMIYNKIQGETQ